MAFSHEVGFYGLVSINKDKGVTLSDPASILATGGSLNLNSDPMFSSGVWGAGWYSAANQVAYAFNTIRLEGSVDFELAAGDIFTAIKNFAFENRAETEGTAVRILPNGAGGYTGVSWCSGCSFSASTDSIVTGSFEFASDDIDKFDPAPQTGRRETATAGGAPSPADSLYPFWATDVSSIPEGVVDWSANYSSEINFVTLCKGQTTIPQKPDFIMVGGMDADGSMTVFGLSDLIDPDKLHTSSSVDINIRPQSNLARTDTIRFGGLIYNSAGTSITTGGDYITADISFTAIGDGTQPPMNLIQGV